MLRNRIGISGKGRCKIGLNTKPYLLQMDSVDLPNMLHTRLVDILSKVQNDPWSLLIFQTLLWSFRRWSIHHLTSPEVNGFIKDYMWDTSIDLVNQFAPDGLKEFAIVWLSPTNIGDRMDLLEELNEYFEWMVEQMDVSIEAESEEMQNNLSVFLDDTINEIIETWLNGRDHFRIYPRKEEDTDKFPSGRIFDIMQRILEQPPPVAVTAPPVPPVPEAPPFFSPPPPFLTPAPPVPAAVAPPPPVPEATPFLPQAYSFVPPPYPPPLPVSAPPPPVPPPEAPPPVPPPEAPIKHTIASALRARRTMRVKGHRSYDKVRERASKTRKRPLNR